MLRNHPILDGHVPAASPLSLPSETSAAFQKLVPVFGHREMMTVMANVTEMLAEGPVTAPT